MKLNNLLMKYLQKLTCIFLCLIYCISKTSSLESSFLKIDIVEAVNMHCALNDEFHCNPYAIVTFKYSEEKRSTQRMQCTKNPKWESAFSFQPEICQDLVYINFFQYLTEADKAYLGPAVISQDRGEASEGYLGRIVLELDKLPFGVIDDWFMLETPTNNSRVMFPSCIHLRLSWTSTKCAESKNLYQTSEIAGKTSFSPKNYIPMCKRDFAMVYKTKFSRLDREGPIRKEDEVSETERIKRQCSIDTNADYGFLHENSNLTSIEEALVFKIVKRTTGEAINYEEFTKNFKTGDNKYVKSYKEFFDKECFKREDLTIERVNNILRNDAGRFPGNETKFRISDSSDYSLVLNNKIMSGVYNDTLEQFYALEDIKNLDKMEDDTYIQTLNKMVSVMKSVKAEGKIMDTLFFMSNKVMLTAEGRVHPKEERFFRIYALYKWNGGKFSYDEIKREYMLRRKYFYCYEIVKIMPTNIILQFIEDLCPDNYVCVDPNGIVHKSKGRNPRLVFKTEIEKNGINFFGNIKDTKIINNNINNVANNVNNLNNLNSLNNVNKIISSATNLRFKSLEHKMNKIKKFKTEVSPGKPLDRIDLVSSSSSFSSSSSSNNNDNIDDNSDVRSFETLLRMEEKLRSDSIKEEFVVSDEDNYMNKFDQLYIGRQIRIKKKKEIIINKVFNNLPLLGESLAIANLGKLDLNIDQEFVNRETNLIKKYLLLYSSDIPFVERASTLLLDLILCNTDKNKVRYLMREMLEGLCYGDDRSIKIFEEITRTVIIDSLIQQPYYYFEDLHAKVNLLKTLNKPFCFKTILKIRFVEAMLMLDIVKERITYIIWNNDTNKKIAIKIHETELAIPVTLPNNKRLFSYASGNRAFDNARQATNIKSQEVTKMHDKLINRINRDNTPNTGNTLNTFSFKSLDKNSDVRISPEGKVTRHDDSDDEDMLNKIKQIREQLDEDLTTENTISSQIQTDFGKTHQNAFESTESVSYEESLKKKVNENKIPEDTSYEDSLKDINKDDSKPDYFESENVEKIIAPKKTKKKARTKKIKSSLNRDDMMNEFKNFDGIYVSSAVAKRDANLDDYDKMHFKQKSQDDLNDAQDLIQNESSEEFAKISLNQYNNPHIFEEQDTTSVLDTSNAPSQSQILHKVMKDPQTRKIIEEAQRNPAKGNKVLFPKEIHSTYEVNRKGTKQVTLNLNNPTKKLILDKLMDRNTFDDLMNQDECNAPDDQTGLFNVLKNIQNRKCSCGFLCIEIGTIYGPFDSLKPKNVTVMTNHKENVQVILKPIIVYNTTEVKTSPQVVQRNMTALFEDDDCDILKTSAVIENTNIYNQNMRFKQLVEKEKLHMKRKFYRKVEYSNEILATEIFKQGLNVIILKREKNYPKVYERTFNTNIDPIDSDAMACVLRDAGYDKIIIITGIGKWMGAITPRLVKEIKQIGGPDLNRLVSVDSEDNSLVDHAFILIGRRGLCRYNGVFRVKNYDISRDLKRYFPDISSDPNDCYFENLNLENEKNKHNERQFFHLVDMRLTLNLDNDSRFSYRAPIITSVSPSFGPLNGGTCLTIRGKNFGTSSLEIKEVLVKGVVCKNVVLVHEGLITCTAGASTIMGPGTGNVQVKLLCGLSSPSNTCSMFEYKNEIVELPSQEIVNHHVTKHVIHHVVPAKLVHPVNLNLALPPVNSLIPMFSFKEKENDDEKLNTLSTYPDNKIIKESLKRKLYTNPDPKVVKIDNLVTDNFKNLLDSTKNNGFSSPRDGFRKHRFSKLIQQLK